MPYKNKAKSHERMKEVQHRIIETKERFNNKRLSESQREKIREDVIREAKKLG